MNQHTSGSTGRAAAFQASRAWEAPLAANLANGAAGLGVLEPTTYLGDAPGYFALLWADGATKRQRCYPLDSMHLVLRDCERSRDTWVSQAEFFVKSRLSMHVKRVSLMFCDLDTYKLNITGSPETLLEKLLSACSENGVPEPSTVVFSGRGLQAKWLLATALPSRALQRWSALQREIGRRLESVGSDHCAMDASRVLRLVGTLNSKSGQVVRVLHHSGIHYEFDALARQILPYARSTHPEYIELRSSMEHETYMGTSLPEAVHFERSRAANDSASPSMRGLLPFSGAALAWDRLGDLRLLARLRGWSKGAPDGMRNQAIFIGASFLAQSFPEMPRFAAELKALARELAPHWHSRRLKESTSTVAALMRASARGEMILFNGRKRDPRYRWTNATLISALQITAEEERQLITMISKTEVGRRDTARHEAKRRAAGVPTRLQWIQSHEARRAIARQMRIEGANWTCVARECGYSGPDSARKSCE